jgi:hypothetical protein
VELERSLPRLREEGFGLAAISYDSAAILENFVARRNITFPLLSDPESKIIKDFGILNEKVQQATQAGIPHPGTFVVDAEGRVMAKYFEEDFRQRYSVSGILADRFGKDIGALRSEQELDFFQLTSTASDRLVRGGQHIILSLEVRLKPGYHVYAPGVKEDYIPIQWGMASSDGWKAGSPSYPQSKKESVAGDPDPVPVYSNRFRITRELVLGAESQLKPLAEPNAEITVKGTFRYQACTERLCFPPQDVPLEWKFQMESFDRERVPEELRRK